MDKLFIHCMKQVEDIIWSFCGYWSNYVKNQKTELTPNEIFETVFWDMFLKRANDSRIQLCFIKYGDSFPELLKTYLRTEYTYKHHNRDWEKEYYDCLHSLPIETK